MKYSVAWSNAALRQLKKLPRKQSDSIVQWVKSNLHGSDDPCSLPNSIPLEGVELGWRWRLGTYRLLGVVDGKRVSIFLFRVGHRREVHRNLSKKP